MSKKVIILLLVAAAAGGYWYSTQQASDGGSASSGADATLMQRVPADTVFFMGGLETIPFVNIYDADSINLFKATTEDQVKQFEMLMGGSGSPAATMVFSLYLDLMDQVYSGGMTEIPDFAFYGLGIYPVVAWESADVKAFSELLNNIETEKNISSRSFTLGHAELREYQIQEGVPLKMYISINGDVVSVGTVSENQDLLKLLAGVDLPAQSLSDTDKLQKLTSTHNLLPFGLFYFDLDTAMKNLGSEDHNLLKQTLQEVSNGAAMAEIEGNLCFDDAAKIITNWPRIVFGYRSLDIKSDPIVMDAAFILENTDSNFLTSLKGIIGTLPDNSFEDDVFSLGYGINVDNIASFISKVRQDFINQVYQCKELVEMQQQAKQSNPGMIAMGTQMVSGLTGVSVHLTSIDMAASMSGDMNAAEGMVVVTAANPKNLLLAGGTFYPPLSQLTIEANGESQPLELPVDVVANISMSENAIVLQVGGSDVTKARIAEIHKGEGLSSGLLRIGMNFSTYFKMLEPLMAKALVQTPPQDTQQMKDMIAVFEKLDMKFAYDINVEDSGIVTSIKVSLKNITQE